ncbi:MAG: SprB repeat-containing protein [Saprospiraceae bacterium]|nr:SprB repeat-containing protein [Saprospiraceae bacterium]
MIRFIFVIWMMNLLQMNLAGQPAICTPPAAMTSFCSQACIICDINGFQGRNNSNVTGQAPPGFCTSFVHHMQWIGFIAGSTNLSIEVHVTNCTRNSGLEIGLYESHDCVTFRRVSECDTDVRPNQRRIFTNTVPLTVGQYYYVVMDGSGDDVCDYSIRVLSGSTLVAPLSVAAPMELPPVICVDELVEFSTTGLTGATFYDWYIDGVFKDRGRETRQKFTKAGTYEICLHAYNVCNSAPVNCRTVEVSELPVKVITSDLCFGQCYHFYGEKYCESGIYTYRKQNPGMCDSLIKLDLHIAEIVTATATYNICAGDTLKLGNDIFTQTGNYQTLITTLEGCQLQLLFSLTVIQCNILTDSDIKPATCSYLDDGSINLRIKQATPPLKYSVTKTENPSFLSSGIVTTLDSEIVITGLDEGHYNIRIEDNYENKTEVHVYVPQPKALLSGTQISENNGFAIRCFGGNDGRISLSPQGGTAPYRIVWPFTASNPMQVQQLTAGNYRLSITDLHNCVLDSTIKLTQPPPLSLSVDTVYLIVPVRQPVRYI